MTRRRRILIVAAALVAVIVAAFMTIAGPWPTYKSGFEDKRYDKDEKGGYAYERGTMSWIGPDQEAFTVSLMTRMIYILFGESNQTGLGPWP